MCDMRCFPVQISCYPVSVGTQRFCPICGNDLNENEGCDDGNRNNGDGCNSTCYTEVGWSCRRGSPSSKDLCAPICGDGIRVTPEEDCDDGNILDGDGCSSSCKIDQDGAAWKILFTTGTFVLRSVEMGAHSTFKIASMAILWEAMDVEITAPFSA